MNDKFKTYCAICDCSVVVDGHADRCRPKTVKGWDLRREQAWLGDSVHRMDVQLAVQAMGVSPAQWEGMVQQYVANRAQASYMRHRVADLVGRSDHFAGTEFEAAYSADFRAEYLRKTFPAVYEHVLAAWHPPAMRLRSGRVVVSSAGFNLGWAIWWLVFFFVLGLWAYTT